MGNSICFGNEHTFDRNPGANAKKDLSKFFSVDDYLSPHSDIVALMVLEHQKQMYNAISAANYENRLVLHQCHDMNQLLERPKNFLSDSTKRHIASSVDRFLRYLPTCDDLTRTEQVTGTPDSSIELTSRVKQNPACQTLHQINLGTRLFEYPCSYLIHVPAFAELPDEVRRPILQRLKAILFGKDTASEFAHLDAAVRQDIVEILQDTIPAFNALAKSN